MSDKSPTPTRKRRKEPPRYGTPEWHAEMRDRDRWVEAQERSEADGYGLAPWEIINDD